ncbi:Transient receptor putative cation channel sub V member 1 [Mortierella sp. AD011]|nr:Transient receptor putative cation channel sub V member 1 [Mortierella sp. AD011]
MVKHDSKASLNASHDELNNWQDIVIQEQLVVHPHSGSARVNMTLRNNGELETKDNEDGSNCDPIFEVFSVEVRPYSCVHVDDNNLNIAPGNPFKSIDVESAGNTPISCISAATEVEQIAIICVENDKVHVSVWDYSKIQTQSGDDKHPFFDEKPKVVKDIYCEDGVSKLPLGISLSPDGKQLAVFQEPEIGDWGAGAAVKEATFKFQLISLDNSVSKSGPGNTEACVISMNEESKISVLQSFVGFAKFLPSTDRGQPKDSDKNSDANNRQSLFAACNGIYLDVFDCSQTGWRHLHSITLADLPPHLSRRITCRMMMESIGPSTFLWLEDQGQTCSTWSITNGANINHLSSEGDVNFTDRVYRSNLKMAISPDESIIALAGVDGSIRTFFAKSGIEINPANHVRFINSKIEYLGFLGRNDRMLAIVHNNTNHKLESRVLDPLDFRFRIKYSPVPIPTAGITLLLAARNASSTSNGQGMVCAADGKFLRFYSTQEIPLDPPVDLSAKPSDKHADKKLEEISATVDSENREYGDAGFQENGELIYSLHISAEAKPLENGDGKDYLALHVSVLQKTKSSDFDTKVLFDFVPEPWLRCPTSMQNKPDQLLTVYFLPCKKRFVIIGYQSIQIWALPSKKYPMVRLLAFWSKPRDFKSLLKEPLSYSEIYDKFHTIDDAWVFETHSDVTQLTVRLFNGTDEKVILPGLSRSHHGALDCHRSIYLLAASYSFASENESYEAHASALVRFAVRYINRITTLGDILGDAKSNVDEHESGDSKPRFESPTPKEHDVELPEIEESDRVDMLRLLIHNIGFQHTSNPFTKAILLTGDWIPREDLTWNPIQQAIEVENHEIVNDLVNSCIDNAKTRHPAYLTLTIGVLDKLKTRYPSLTSKIFSEASYIKVKNKAYISTNAIVAKPPYQLWKSKSTHWSEYDNPVFCIQTQLPFQTIKPKSFIDRLLESIMQPERTKSFPENQGESNTLGNKKTQQSLHTSNERCYDIYVVPFSKLSTYSASGKDISKFTEIAGTSLLDNPAMVATLQFKWYKFGMVRWAARFSLVFAFSLLFIIITIAQINAVTDDERYLTGWDNVVYAVISLGGVCLLFEIWQFMWDWKMYLSSPYNYLDLASFGLPILGCMEFLIDSQGDHLVQGPHLIWWISFALLAVYVNVMFELKVFRPLGIAVHIILNIARRIIWFMAVFAITLIAFTHAFMHITHTRKNKCLNLTGEEQSQCEALESKYPKNFTALFSTFFFIAGIYDPLSNDLDPNSDTGYSFRILLSLFIFFTVILLMNVLIAIMNDGYSESRDEGQSTWLKQWSEVIVDAELFMMRRSTRQNKYFFPDYIYYAARPQDVEDYERKEAAKRLLEYQTSDVIMSSITKDKSKKKIMSVHQDVKYVLENQLKIERLMKTLHSISDPNSGHRRDGVFGTPHQHETAAQGHSVTKVDHITSASTVEQPTTEHPITHEPGANKGASSVQDLDNVSTPVVPTGSSWFRRKIRQTEAAAREIKNAASNAIHDRIGQISRHNTPTHVINVAHIEDETNNDVEDVEETVKETEVKGGEAFEPAMPTYIAAIDKPSVDELCPVRKTSQVYCDGDTYSAVLTDILRNVTCVIQLLYCDDARAYYIYYRYGESDCHLDGILMDSASAKLAFDVTYKDIFGVEWSERETAYSGKLLCFI